MKKQSLYLLCAAVTLACFAGCSKSNAPTTEKPVSAEKPAPPAPPALKPVGWSLNLADVKIPDQPVTGRINGADWKADRASFSGSTLKFMAGGSGGKSDSGLVIVFYDGTELATAANKTITIRPDTKMPPNKGTLVQWFWKGAAGAQRKPFNSGYALRLEFGALANNQIQGSIYVCTPDDAKSCLAGTFIAEAKPERK